MKSKNWYYYLVPVLGAIVCGQAINYFLSGENYRNTGLRNFAVVLQIIFGLALIGYSFYQHKRNFLTEEKQ